MKRGASRERDPAEEPELKTARTEQPPQQVLELAVLPADTTVELLPELLPVIFLFLLPQDLLFRASLVSRLWREKANDPLVWQSLLRQHFPFIEYDYPDDFKLAPAGTFQIQYTYLCEEIDEACSQETCDGESSHFTLFKPYVLAILRGELHHLMKVDYRDAQYILCDAAANGHLTAVDFISSTTRLFDTMEFAIQSRQLHVAKHIVPLVSERPQLHEHIDHSLHELLRRGIVDLELTTMLFAHIPQDNNEERITILFETAIIKGRIDFVQLMLKHYNLASFCGHALFAAVTHNHPNIVLALLTLFKLDLTPNDKRRVLKEAALQPHIAILDLLLRNIGFEFSSRDKNQILFWCVDSLERIESENDKKSNTPTYVDELNLFRILLGRWAQAGAFGPDISDMALGTALHFAAAHGWLDVVTDMIARRPALSNSFLNLAFNKASSNKQSTIVEFLLTLNKISDEEIEECLDFASSHGDETTAKIIRTHLSQRSANDPMVLENAPTLLPQRNAQEKKHSRSAEEFSASEDERERVRSRKELG